MSASHTRRTFLAGAAGSALAMSTLGATAQDGGKPVRIGIVGGGFGCSFHWHLHPQCQVTAVCDIQDRPLERLKQTYGCANAYKNFREMLKHPDLNAVGVFTPAPLHAWMAIEAMKAGKHVISAVPAAMSQEELEAILECVKSTGMNYMMAETSYYHPEIIFCREARERGEFGTLSYSEAEYHHEGLLSLFFDDRGLPTWRHGFPPMHYPTHCTGMIVPVTGERLAEVMAIGWGDNHEVLQTNQYENPFWNTHAFFKTSGGHAARVSVCWHMAVRGAERGGFYGDYMSYIDERPEGVEHTICRMGKDGQTVVDANGYPQGILETEKHACPDYFDRLPEPLRVPSGHRNSHTFLTHEFVSSIAEARMPAVNIYEAIAYTLPGIIAHQSALRGGELMKIPDYGRA